MDNEVEDSAGTLATHKTENDELQYEGSHVLHESTEPSTKKDDPIAINAHSEHEVIDYFAASENAVTKSEQPADMAQDGSSFSGNAVGTNNMNPVQSSVSSDSSISGSFSQKRRPGWKGWLRSASSTNTFVLRSETNRKHMSAHGRVSHAEQSHQLLEDTFRIKRAETMADMDLDWSYFSKLLQSSSPRDLLQMSSYLRHGVSDHFRGILWQAASRSKNQELEDVYAELKLDSSGSNDKQISKDLSRMSRSWIKLLEGS